LEILEYCDTSNTYEREQHYLDLLKPKYNILTKAGSSLGHKHSEETLIKFKARKMTPEQLAKLRAHLDKLNSKEMPQEIRAKISAGSAAFNVKTKGKPVLVTNSTTQVTTEYVSACEAARRLNISKSTILRYLKRQVPYLGIYEIRPKPL
jgi:group I intron endonuclease